MQNFFIDKLNVYQVHDFKGENLPLLGRKATIDYDLVTGQLGNVPLVAPLKHEGSFSSSLQISCDGGRIEVRGNPSRWGRMDNLFGLYTFDECIAVYNYILVSLGLPPFTKCTQLIFLPSRFGKDPSKTSDGAIITHVDFTRNLVTGLGNERHFLKALSSHSVNRSVPAYLYPNELTVEWYGKNFQKNGSDYRYLKVYSKIEDLLNHQGKNTRGANYDDLDYYEKLLQFTVLNGICREEHSFKNLYLKKHNLFMYGLIKESDFLPELQSITDIRKRLEVTKMEYETIADHLLAEGICKSRQSANATQMYYAMWLHGQSLDKTKSQYRVHKSRLLQIGIDISIKLDISRAPLRLKNSQVIEVSEITPPAWYRFPVIPFTQPEPPKPTNPTKSQLKLVA